MTSLVESRRGIASPVVALTFDDGPAPWTEPIARHLEAHGGHGTFFAIGEAIDETDWDKPAGETAERVLADLEPGDIVRLRDGRPASDPPDVSGPTREATVDAVALILDAMTRRGLRAVTFSGLLAAT